MGKKIGIIGAGAIGCFVGGHLLREGADVYFLGRERLGKKIKAHGLTITEINGDSFFLTSEKIKWLTQKSDLPLLDLIIITTKSQDTKVSALEVQDKLKSDGLVVSLQNGVHNSEILKSIFCSDKVVTGMVPFNVIEQGGMAHFKQSTAGHIYLNRKVESFGGMPVEIVKNIEEIQWGKLIKNLNNALNALSNIPLATQLQNKKERELLSKVIKEAFAVLQMNHIKACNTSFIPIKIFPLILLFPNSLFHLATKKELKTDPSARLSMWLDLELKRKTEIDYLNGEVVRLAKLVNLSVPFNEKIVSLIKLAESGKLDSARIEYQKLLS